MIAYDLVIRGGDVCDGTGAPLKAADVAVKDGVIVSVGRVDGAGNQEVDAAGALVTPGFVDIHTHYDGQATWDSTLSPSSWHGVTSVVMGNCGVGFAPIHSRDRQLLIELMEGVEDIPGTALHEGLSWDWQSFPDYLDALARRPHDVDIATQIPHAALRFFAMGEKAADGVKASEDEIRQMATLAKQAIEAGALGFSTSWTKNHKSSTGAYTPTLAADDEELRQIASAIGETKSGVLQLVDDYSDAEESFARMRMLIEASGRPLSFSLGQAPPVPNLYKEMLEQLTKAVAVDGLPIRAQVAPRGVGMLLGLDTSLNPFVMNPVYREVQGRPVIERAALMREPDFRSRLLAAVNTDKDDVHTGGRLIYRYDRMYELGDPPQYEPAAGTSIAERASAENRRPEELLMDIYGRGDGADTVYLFILGLADGTLDSTAEMLSHPYTIIGLGDGGAHVGSICDASFATTSLTHWGRDRQRGRLPLPLLVQRQTQATAVAVGLHDRGVIAPGYQADINVIDFENLRALKPEVVHDLPAGGRRIIQRANGYLHTFIRGIETYREGKPTGFLPGKVVRGAQSAPVNY
jgi:N-acyl-D-aspartate/D-glutamate deacylase